MNEYMKNLNRLEFVVTWACTGKCRHCSEGDHLSCGEKIDAEAAAQVVRRAAEQYAIQSVMTFGGEPLLCPEAVFRIHSAAAEMNIPRRQLITNGFFTRDESAIRTAAHRLSESGVNDILLSADSFHQETIPIEPVKRFAEAVLKENIPLRMSPAWLVSPEADNPWNRKTHKVLSQFTAMGIPVGSGNVIFPAGNALRYLGEYFDADHLPENPYVDDPFDVRCVSVCPDGSALGGNIYESDILALIVAYSPR